MLAQSVLLLRIIIDIYLHGIFICTVGLRRSAALALYALIVISFFTVLQII